MPANTILDANGRPVKSSALLRDYAYAKREKARLPQSGAMSPETVYRAIKRAETGDTTALQDLLFRVSLDPRVTADSTKRVDKLRTYEFDVVPYEEADADPDDKDAEIAAFVREVLTNIPKWKQVLTHLGRGRLFGWSVGEIRWEWVGDVFIPVEIKQRPTRNFRPVKSGFEKYTERGWQGDMCEPYRYVIHAFEHDGSAILGGLLLRCVFPVLAKNWTLTQWGKLLDLVGCGITDVTYKKDEGGDQKTAEDLASATGRQLWAAMNSAYEITRHFPSGKEAGHKDFHFEANGAISEVLTGARLTTEAGDKGARSLGVVHQDELEDLRAGDGEDLTETIDTQLIIPIVVFNYGPQPNFPKSVLRHEDSADLVQEITVDEKLHGMGVDLSKDDLRKRYGRAAPEGDEDRLPGLTLTPGPLTPASLSVGRPSPGGRGDRGEGFRAFSAGRNDDDTTATDEVLELDDFLQDAALSAIDEAKSVDAMLTALRDLVADAELEHTGRVGYELYRVSAIAHLAGILGDMKEHGEEPEGLTLTPNPSPCGRGAVGTAGVRAFATVIDQWADVPMEEAIEWFKRKGIVTQEQWEALDANYRHRAFYASKIGTVHELRAAHSAILDALETGRDRDSVVKDLTEKLGRDRKDRASRQYLRFLFDENVSSAQAYGRWARQERTRDVRPLGRYVSMDDGRVRPAHQALHGTVLPLDDPWWATNTPKNGYACRCERNTLDTETAERRGWTVSDGAGLPQAADSGWEGTPATQASADERMNALKKAAEDNELLYGYDIPNNVIVSTAGGKLVLVGERKAE